MLDIDSLRDTSAAKHMFTVCNDRLCWVIIAYGALFLALNKERKGLLQKGSVFFIQYDHILIIKKAHEIVYSFPTEGPVIASIGKSARTISNNK